MITTPVASPQRHSLMKKQIPTLLGLVVLIAGLAIGAFLFSSGTGIFLPRATPETTPKSIRISNVTDQGFSVTFMTDSATSGFIRYGTDPKKLTQIGDQRDQLTNTVGEYTLHQISILRGLEANTTYYYVLGTGKGALFDDEGQPFTIKTARQSGTQPKALTVFGSAVTASGAPATGAVVFVTPPNARTLSSIVTNAGSWAVSLSNARTLDGSEYAKVAEGDELAIQVMAVEPADNTELTATVETETAIAIQLGKGADNTAAKKQTNETESVASASAIAETDVVSFNNESATASSDSSSIVETAASESAATRLTMATGSAMVTTTATESSTIAQVETPVEEVTTFSLDAPASEKVTVTTEQPVITGTLPANVVVSFEIHSETALTTQVTTDANGEFTLDLTEYEHTLEPGEHTVTYSYTDPATNKLVTKTKTFTVAPRVTLAAATPLSTPYGSSNPYPITSPSTTPTTSSASATSTKSATTASPSARTATRSSSLASGSGLLTAGSVGTTMLLIGGGLFFMISGFWSWWISRELAQEYS